MKSAPRNHKAERPVLMYKKDIRKMQTEFEQTAIILFMAYMMDEEGWTDEKTLAMWDSLEKWLLAVKEHLISVDYVKKLIREQRNWEFE